MNASPPPSTPQPHIRLRGKPRGLCNLCLVEGDLTADHIPPKGAYRPKQADLLHVYDHLSVHRPRNRSAHLQGGLLFRSLCARCNNTVLGSNCDPALIGFAKGVHQYLATPFLTPSETTFRTCPGLVARAVLGHLFAVGVHRNERTATLTAAQHFVLDETAPLPPGIELRYWLYPYRHVVAIRDMGIISLVHDAVVCWCLKFYPLGFIVTFGEVNDPRILRLPSLRDYMLHAGLHEAELPLRLMDIPHETWPEAPAEHGAVMHGSGSVMAVARVRK